MVKYAAAEIPSV